MASSSADGLVHQLFIGHAVCPDPEVLKGGLHAGLRLFPARDLGLQLLPFLLQVHPHQFRPDVRKEPDDEGGADQVRHRIGDRNVIDQHGLLRGRDAEAVDGIAGRADDRGFRKGPGQQTRRRPHVIPQDFRGEEGSRAGT